MDKKNKKKTHLEKKRSRACDGKIFWVQPKMRKEEFFKWLKTGIEKNRLNQSESKLKKKFLKYKKVRATAIFHFILQLPR